MVRSTGTMVAVSVAIIVAAYLAADQLLVDLTHVSPLLDRALEAATIASAAGAALWSAVIRRLRGDAEAERRLNEAREAALRAEATDALRHLAVVRYDAFGDMGGHLSWSLALLDDGGDGVVLTSIHGRSEARTYAKSIAGWSCDQQLSPEELEAIEHARP